MTKITANISFGMPSATVQNVTNKAYWAGQLYYGLGVPRTVLLSATVDF